MASLESYNSTEILISTVSIAGVALLIVVYRREFYRKLTNFWNPLRHQTIEVLVEQHQCKEAVRKIREKCCHYKVLGFDCEWVTLGRSRNPIALLQLATSDGYCALIRLNMMEEIPSDLKDLLEDASILKVGVAAIDDAKYLLNDYGICVDGIIDLRHIALFASQKPEGLSNLAASHLNVKMDKDWRIRCSDWEAEQLSERQIRYAATDAHAAVEIFKKLTHRILRNDHGYKMIGMCEFEHWKHVESLCRRCVNVKFTYKDKSQGKEAGKNMYMNEEILIYDRLKLDNKKLGKYSCLKRSKPLYHNCYMQSPDGEVLCTCDNKKAEWYVEKQIADLICEDPYTIRLRFEPAGRSVGDVGKYYQKPRYNRCVCCGHDESYTRKNVVPREYRRLFPAVMKDHSSHDVLLLCSCCHQLSNNKDQHLRLRLAAMCNAPIYNTEEPKQLVDRSAQKVISAARALLKSTLRHNIPEERKALLTKIVLDYYGLETLSEDVLIEASQLCPVSDNEAFESHGKIVVEYFTNQSGGLLALEQMWREHFLETMAPRYMPELWSVTHTKSRLKIRAEEGRVDPQDLIIAGLAVENHFSHEPSNKSQTST